MPDVAFQLAALRAERVRPLSGGAADQARRAAAVLGRRLVEVGGTASERRVVLGWQDGCEPNPDGDIFPVRRLSQVPLVAIAICLGLCWREIDHPPFPGEPTTLGEVELVAARIGLDRAHLIGSLRHELSLAGLVALDGTAVRLGFAVAAWTPSQIDALRRFADVLPRPEGS